MSFLRVALAQINPTVGALQANGRRIAEAARSAAEQGADLVVFPEMALCGYPPEDLVLRPHFLRDVERRLAALESELPRDVVCVVGAPRAVDNHVRNSAFVYAGGRRLGVYDKILLPNYGVFDEVRLFRPGERPGVLRLGPWHIGLHICEDSWRADGLPCTGLRGTVHAVINLSSSPYHYRKIRLRERVLGAASRAIGAPLLYCNLVGGQDELVFDGGSLGIDRSRVFARAKLFEEDLLLVDLPEPARPPPRAAEREVTLLVIEAPAPARPNSNRRRRPPRIEPLPGPEAEVYAALVTGLRDYVQKNGFQGVVIGLSGGVDSSLTAAIAVDALGAGRVHGVSMPSRYTSAGTRTDARRLAESLGIHFIEQPIERLFTTFLEELSPHWQNRPPDITEENLQARIRGVILMAFSNKFGWLVLSTGNKSEIATGYCTLYGDMVGGFAVLKDVPKTLVWRLARWRNRQGARPVIPPSIIHRVPTAELRPNQTDQDTLPPYPLLDAILERYIERDEGAEEIIAAGFDAATVRRVARMVDRNEYKRRQAAPGVKITPKAFGRDRRIPITNAYEPSA